MASRTETSCPPGCIQVTEETHALAEPQLHTSEVVFEDRGEVDVKGAAKPIRMFLAKCGDETDKGLDFPGSPPPELCGLKTTEDGDGSFGSKLLPCFPSHHGKVAEMADDDTQPDIFTAGQLQLSSALVMGWDSNSLVMGWD